MTFKILPQVLLRTYKEYRNVLHTKINQKNGEDSLSVKKIDNDIYKHTPNTKTHYKATRKSKVMQLTIIPVILAIVSEPEKPPKMKASDLPIYDSPHAKYKEFEEDKIKCCKYREKMVHKNLYPYVRTYRSLFCDVFGQIEAWYNYVKCQVSSAIAALEYRKCRFLSYMRDDCNLNLRKAVTAFGTAAGFAFGSRKFLLTRNIFLGVIGGLITGWLCFPKETDATVREVCFFVGNAVVYILNAWCGCKDIRLEKRERLMPCLKNLCEPISFYSKGQKACWKYNLKKKIEENLAAKRRMEEEKKLLEEQLKAKLQERKKTDDVCYDE